MTSNQIEYAKHTENVRHNLATEKLGSGNLTETVRHNVATEKLGSGNLAETTRHNVASEGISSGNLDELRRHNLVTEGLTSQQIMNNYTVGLKQASAAQQSASAAMKQAQVANQRQFEDARHNIQSETISMSEIDKKYANLAGQLSESQRHNKAQEDLKNAELAVDMVGNLMNMAGRLIPKTP